MSTTVTGVRIVDMPDLGTFNSASSLVGERAGSGRFSASGLAGYFLPIAGGMMTGNLQITGAAGTGRAVNGLTGGVPRWSVVIGDASAETGSAAGSNFAIYRYNDAGTVVDSPLVVDRASGNVTILRTVTADAVDTNTVVSTTINNGGTISTDTLDANSVQSTAITGATVAASGSFTLPVSGGYLSANVNTVEFAMDTATWRWEYVRSNGTLRWINGGTAQSLMSIDGAGNMILRGTLAANGAPVLDVVQELRDTVTALEARVAALELTA